MSDGEPRQDDRMILEGEAPYRFIASPIQMSCAPAAMRRVPPKLGEHTDEVLAEAKVSR